MSNTPEEMLREAVDLLRKVTRRLAFGLVHAPLRGDINDLLSRYDALSPGEPGTSTGVGLGEYIVVAVKYSTKGSTVFWNPKGAGYTWALDKAGRYTKEEAEDCVRGSHGDHIMVTFAEAEAQATRCVSDHWAHRWKEDAPPCDCRYCAPSSPPGVGSGRGEAGK